MNYVHDSIWGEIQITPLMQKFIKTYEFQRLRNIKQLGTAQFAFPCATNTRFEHCIGVSHIARKMVSKLTNDKRLIELVSIAGLLHDIGHGPMSHNFDFYCDRYSFFTKPLYNVHEYRSIYIIRKMIGKYKIPITEFEIDLICNCIKNQSSEQKWYYSIIDGKIDADRIDYIIRDSKNTGVGIVVNRHDIDKIINCIQLDENKQICFDNRADDCIKRLLDSREYLYKSVYHHKISNYLNEKIIEIMHKVWHKKEQRTDIEDFFKVPFNDLFLEYYYLHGSKEVKQKVIEIINFDEEKIPENV